MGNLASCLSQAKVMPQKRIINWDHFKCIDIWYFWLKVNQLEAEYFSTSEFVKLFFEHPGSSFLN